MSFDIFDAYATDENLENNGTSFPLGKDATLLVACAGNRKYTRALTKAIDLRRVELDAKGDDSLDVSDQIMISVMSETILLGWSGLKFKGVDMPFTVENAKTLLTIKDFRKMVSTLSDQMDSFKFKAEVVAGNV